MLICNSNFEDGNMHSEIREYLQTYCPSALVNIDRINKEIEEMKAHGVEIVYSAKITNTKTLP